MQNEPEPPEAVATKPWLNAQGSRYFLDWLAEQRISLAFTTYQTGKVFFVGRKPDHSISGSSVLPQTLTKPWVA